MTFCLTLPLTKILSFLRLAVIIFFFFDRMPCTLWGPRILCLNFSTVSGPIVDQVLAKASALSCVRCIFSSCCWSAAGFKLWYTACQRGGGQTASGSCKDLERLAMQKYWKQIKYSVCIWVCVCVCVRTRISSQPVAARGTGSLELELRCTCWKPNLGPLQKQEVLCWATYPAPALRQFKSNRLHGPLAGIFNSSINNNIQNQ